MELTGHYRHELKYEISLGGAYALARRLSAVMQPDPHVDKMGRYRIRSIYFDNLYDKALREKLDGVQLREKFRIRYYNDDVSHLTLEKKIKHNDLCMKVSAPVSQADCRRLLNGDLSWMTDDPSELVRELYCKMRTQQLRPRVLVSYVRTPYVYAPGNVRVTFDTEIRTSLFAQKFLTPEVHDISAADTPQTQILEVKFDAYLPDGIASLLQMGNLRQQAFSKYAVCRRFG